MEQARIAKLEDVLKEVRTCYQDYDKLRSDLRALVRDVATLAPHVGTFSGGGKTATLFYLYGVVPVSYKGNSYNIPVTFYFDPPYPKTAPRCFVTPTKNMVLSSGHPQVDQGGMIYMPYLSNWDRSSNLHVLVTKITSVFESRSPVYAIPDQAHGKGKAEAGYLGAKGHGKGKAQPAPAVAQAVPVARPSQAERDRLKAEAEARQAKEEADIQAAVERSLADMSLAEEPANKAGESGSPNKSTGTERSRRRWGEGLDAPKAGARDFFPAGWVPQKDWRDAIAVFGHSASELTQLSTTGDRLAEDFEEAYEAKPRGDSMAIVYSYTEENDHDVYGSVNYTMRTATKVAEVKLKKYREYIYYLGQGLDCFPNFVGICYRGISKRFPAELYEVGSTVTWQPFSSATRNLSVTQNFLKEEGGKLIGSLFILNVNTAKDIELASAVPDEEEVLLRYNTFLKVEGRITDKAEKQRELHQFSAYNLADLDVYRLRQL